MSADAPPLREKWHVYNYEELKLRCNELGSEDCLIEGLLPKRSLALLVGDSGLGKSPLLYQASLCIATGVPFLGHPVKKGNVLFLDFENGLRQVAEIITSLLGHLGLEKAPDSLLLWNRNDCVDSQGKNWILDLIKEVKPDLVILDSITAASPDVEEKNSTATKLFQMLRRDVTASGAAVVGVHHLKKPSSNDLIPSLAEDPRNWFHRARGASALINGCDVRLGVDLPEADSTDLILRGFMRVAGEIAPIHLARVFDDDGEPIGYDRLTGARLLSNSGQQSAFENLPDSFRFKQAQQIYGKGAQPTTNFLRKCLAVGILRKGEGGYAKVKPVE